VSWCLFLSKNFFKSWSRYSKIKSNFFSFGSYITFFN